MGCLPAARELGGGFVAVCGRGAGIRVVLVVETGGGGGGGKRLVTGPVGVPFPPTAGAAGDSGICGVPPLRFFFLFFFRVAGDSGLAVLCIIVSL